MEHAITITSLYRTQRQPIFRDSRSDSHGATRNNIGNVIIIIVIYAKCLERTYIFVGGGDSSIIGFLSNRISNRHSFNNQVFVTGVINCQRLLTSKRPIDGCAGNALSSRRLSNEVEEQIAPLNNGHQITAALCYADRDHRPGPFWAVKQSSGICEVRWTIAKRRLLALWNCVTTGRVTLLSVSQIARPCEASTVCKQINK